MLRDGSLILDPSAQINAQGITPEIIREDALAILNHNDFKTATLRETLVSGFFQPVDEAFYNRLRQAIENWLPAYGRRSDIMPTGPRIA